MTNKGDPSRALPPDRSHVQTESRHPRSMHLHTLSTAECVELMANEDRAVHEAMDRARPTLTAFLEDAEPRFARGGRLIYIGAGTSGRLGVLDASEAPPTFQVEPGRVVGVIAGGDTALRVSSEGLEDDPDGARKELNALQLTANDTLLGIAAGGTTPYVRGSLEIAKECAAAEAPLTAFLTCTPMERPRGADHLIMLETGPELITGSTRMKAGTATKLALNMISTTLMVRTGRVYENLMVDLRATNDKLRDRAARIITTLTGLERGAAFILLDRAGGYVKAAIVMQMCQVSRDEAEAMLETTQGRLDEALIKHKRDV